MASLRERWAVRQQRSVFNVERRGAFYDDLASMMDSGQTPFRAIQKMHRVYSKERNMRKIAAVYKRMLNAMGESGEDAGKAIASEVPPNEAVVITSAEKAGENVMQESMRQLGDLLSRQLEVKRKLFKTLVSNGISFAAIIAVMYVIVSIVVPQLNAATTPEMARAMSFAPKYFAFGAFVVKYGIFIGIGLIALIAWIRWSIPRWYKPRRFWSRQWFDRHLLPWSFSVRTNATFFLFSVSSMLHAGLPLKQSLNSIVGNTSPWMRFYINGMLRRLNRGMTEVDAMNNGMLPKETATRLALYSSVPDFTSVMRRMADDNFKFYERRIDGLAAVMKTAVIIILAVFIASTLFAVFDFSNAISGISKPT